MKKLLSIACVTLSLFFTPLVTGDSLETGEQLMTVEPPHTPSLNQEEYSEEVLMSPEEAALLEATTSVASGEWESARAKLLILVEEYPDNPAIRHRLAELLWYFYNDRGEAFSTLQEASDLALEAGYQALNTRDFRPKYGNLVGIVLGALGDGERLHAYAEEALGKDPSSLNYVLLARALALRGDPDAAAAFRTAIELSGDGLREYATWLIEQERFEEVVQLSEEDSAQNNYPFQLVLVRALRGLGRQGEADVVYRRYLMNTAPPVDEKLLLNSKSQFEESPHSYAEVPNPGTLTQQQAIKGLAALVHGEAGAESIGGERAVAWIVRNRVLRGAVGLSPGPYCPGQYNSGESYADKYKSVMCASGQFDGMCMAWCVDETTTSCPEGDSWSVASDVYQGKQPDPVGNHCPAGLTANATNCSNNVRCSGDTETYRIAGSLFNFGTNEPCPSDPPRSGCTVTTLAGKACGNGGLDNCFYRHEHYSIFSNYSIYSCTINTQGAGCISSQIVTTGTRTFYGHLEGPNNLTATHDFDLYLQKFNPSTGTWSDAKKSFRLGTVEDISSSQPAGTYRWRVVAFKGTGSFKLYATNL